MFHIVLLFAAGFWGGAQSALAGGGSFVTLPALMLASLDARMANITSTVALFPAQGAAGFANRHMVTGFNHDPFPLLFVVSLFGGIAGAVLLLFTPKDMFETLVPWLVLFSTALFAFESFGPSQRLGKLRTGRFTGAAIQFAIAVYGGFFGGGNGIIMMALLTAAGVGTRAADATKNVLAAAMNGAAVLIFVFSSMVSWSMAAALACGAIGGGLVGAWLIQHLDTKRLRVGVLVIGLILTIGLFLR